MSERVTLLACIRAKQGRGDEIAAALEDYCQQLRDGGRPETIVVYRLAKDSEEYWLVEDYPGRDALKSHQEWQPTQKLADLFADAADPIDVRRIEERARHEGV